MVILAICGSLRRLSYNRGLLTAAVAAAPAGVTAEIAGIEDIPVFNEDLEAEGWPPAVAALRARAHAADALLFGCPEYNYGIAGPLKNAFDWLSRPERAGHEAPAAGQGYAVPRNPVMGKPCGLLGASLGLGGTIRAQLALRQSLQLNGALTMPGPEVFVTYARDKFDGDSHLTDAPTLKAVAAFMEAFVAWAARQAGPRA
jgi:chromate reductase